MTKTKGLLFTAGIALAMAFIFSCSGGGGNEPQDLSSSSWAGTELSSSSEITITPESSSSENIPSSSSSSSSTPSSSSSSSSTPSSSSSSAETKKYCEYVYNGNVMCYDLSNSKFSKLFSDGKCQNYFRSTGDIVTGGELKVEDCGNQPSTTPVLISEGWCVYDVGGGGFVINLTEATLNF